MTPAARAKELPTAVQLLGDQATKLRCLACGSALELCFLSERPDYPELGPDGTLACNGCSEQYPVIAGTPRMLAVEHLSSGSSSGRCARSGQRISPTICGLTRRTA